MASKAVAEETDLEEALSAASQEMVLTSHCASPRRGEIWTAMLETRRCVIGS